MFPNSFPNFCLVLYRDLALRISPPKWFLSERIYNSLDAGGETRAIALDISKAFDKVWHAGLLHKLKGYGVVGRILRIFESFLQERSLKVVLEGHSSPL